MSSILNSISSGDLQVQQVPGDIPVKEDSIIDLLQNSEIEFKTCPKPPNKLVGMNTGFGEGQELHYNTPCKKPELQVPLYKNNYLNEFVTEEEKAAARKAIGIYAKSDVITNGLLTITDDKPSIQEIVKASIRQLKQSDEFVAPITVTKAVLEEDGSSLSDTISNIRKALKKHKEAVDNIVNTSNNKAITSLGDVKVFLQGFNNGDNLHQTLETMNKEQLRFEKTGNVL